MRARARGWLRGALLPWLLLALASCGDFGPVRAETYLVEPGDTLYSIAWRNDLDYRDIARWNGLPPDLRIAPGQVLFLRPTSFVTRPSVPAPRAAVARVGRPKPLPEAPAQVARPDNRAPAPAAAPTRTPASAPAPAPPALLVSAAGKLIWVWPTARSTPIRVASAQGMLIGGALGQAINAAAAGKVVYTGSGLRGYGNLVIIKHSETLLSAYGYNRELLVHEGQSVAAGQAIARMGSLPGQAPALYFEIRRNGRPVNPMAYLSSG
jgi:lipoprotein NlpD